MCVHPREPPFLLTPTGVLLHCTCHQKVLHVVDSRNQGKPEAGLDQELKENVNKIHKYSVKTNGASNFAKIEYLH